MGVGAGLVLVPPLKPRAFPTKLQPGSSWWEVSCGFGRVGQVPAVHKQTVKRDEEEREFECVRDEKEREVKQGGLRERKLLQR